LKKQFCINSLPLILKRFGYIQRLLSAIPKVADWNRSALPKSLSQSQLELFLQAFDISDSTQLRDYAIALCLIDLGLRGCEVAALRLENMDWRAGILTVCVNKSKRIQQLPLPSRTGEAIVLYLRQGRPQTSNRAVFVRHVAPYDKPISVDAIRNAMTRAFVRCGLGDQFCNTHVFRHTVAVRLQKTGASLKEIADVLRHQSLETTTAYAKVDLEGLRVVALPWPSGRSV
jgi:integrase